MIKKLIFATLAIIQNNSKSHTVLISSIFVIYFAITLGYSLYTPALQGHDETAHYLYTLNILDGNKQSIYSSTQPLYYLIGNLLLLLVKGFTSNNILLIHFFRVFSIFCGFITVFFSYKIAKIVFKNNQWLPFFTTSFVALIPTFDWINSVVNNDVLVWSLTTISIYFLLKFTNEPQKVSSLLLSATFASLAISTKENAMIIFPVLIADMCYLLRLKAISVTYAFKCFFGYIATTIVISSWEMIYRLMINNDPTDFGLIRVLRHIIFHPNLVNAVEADSTKSNISEGISRITDPGFLLTRLFKHAFGSFGIPFIWPPEIYLNIALAIFVVSFIGLLLLIIRKNAKSMENINKRLLIVLISSAVFILGITYLDYLVSEVGVIRYTFPIISAYGVLFTLGLYSLVFRPRLTFLLLIPLIFLIVLNTQLLLYLNYQREPDFEQLPRYFAPFENLKFFNLHSNDPLLDTKNWTNMTKVDGYGYVDYVDAQSTTANAEILGIQKNLVIHPIGWALFADKEMKVYDAYVFIDGTVYNKAYYGLWRPDVPSVLGRQYASDAGWNGVIDLRDLSTGCHALAVKIIHKNFYHEISDVKVCKN